LPVGSGDAFTAGWAAARLSPESASRGEQLRLAAAVARANARVLEAGDVTVDSIVRELAEVRDARPAGSEHHD
jgi:fructose-1-phosphate kinase PfkB-like protein